MSTTIATGWGKFSTPPDYELEQDRDFELFKIRTGRVADAVDLRGFLIGLHIEGYGLVGRSDGLLITGGRKRWIIHDLGRFPFLGKPLAKLAPPLGNPGCIEFKRLALRLAWINNYCFREDLPADLLDTLTPAIARLKVEQLNAAVVKVFNHMPRFDQTQERHVYLGQLLHPVPMAVSV